MQTIRHSTRNPQRAFTLMEVLVCIAILIVLAAVAYPVWISVRQRANRQIALKKMEHLGHAISTFAAANNGLLPVEESEDRRNDWRGAAGPSADKAWYNALPRALGMKGVGDFYKSGNTARFYSEESPLFLPGADYPQSRSLASPQFAYTFNSKLHRKDPDTGKKAPLTLARIANPGRTVAFLEHGLRGEKKPFPWMKPYDGGCNASARAFIARYGDTGIITFLDGHAELVKPSQILESDGGGGRIVWNATDASGIFWCADPAEDPN